MKRRNLIIRTVTGILSASVFSVTGWLMGTRSLTMPNGIPGPWEYTWYNSCNNNPIDCNCADSSGFSCSYDPGCSGPGSNAFCRYYEYQWWRCCMAGSLCMLQSRIWSCASCNIC